MIRTEKVPFVQSRASRPLLYSTFCAIAVVTAIPFTPFGTALGLHALPAVYFACLLALVLGYMTIYTPAQMHRMINPMTETAAASPDLPLENASW